MSRVRILCEIRGVSRRFDGALAINQKFGLTPEQIDELDTRRKVVIYATLEREMEFAGAPFHVYRRPRRSAA